MASQSYDRARNRFFLDLHGVLKRDAGRVIRKRLDECCRFGIDSLEVVYGTPDFFDGSIASALHEAVSGNPQVIAGRLPREFLDSPEQYTQRVARVLLHLKPEPGTLARDEAMGFTPFPASRERDAWQRRLCENWFYPLRASLTAAEAAQFIGDGCTPADIPQPRVSMAELEALCRSWKRPVAPAPPSAPPSAEAAPPAPPTPRERWEHAWSETAAALAQGDYALAQVQLQACMQLSAQEPDSILLARTLAALGDLQGRKNQGAAAESYYHSALAAFDAGPYSQERLEVESRLVESLLIEGRMAEAAAVWRSARERLLSEALPNAVQLVYVLSSESTLRARLDDLDTAAQLLGQAVDVAAESPAVPPITAASLRLHLGLLHAARGDLRRTVAQLSKAAEELELCRAAPAQLILCGRELAVAAAELGYRGRPEASLRELLEYATRSGPAHERDRLHLLSSLSNILFRQERWSEAEACIREGLPIALARPDDFRVEIFMMREDLASIYTHLGRHPEAEQEFQEALRLGARIYPPHHNALAHAKQNLAVLYTRAGRYQEARALHEDVLLTFESYFAGPNPDVALAHHNYGVLLAGFEEWAEAERHLRAALRTYEAIFGPLSAELARSLTSLAEVLTDQQRFTQARPVVQRAVDLLESGGWDRALLGESYWALGRAQHGMGNTKAAEKSLHRAQYYGWLAGRK